MNQKCLFLLVGCPASGKSTYIKNILPLMKSARVISRDELRFALVAEDEPYFSREEEVFDCFINEIRNAIKEYDDIFVDATHINENSRKKILRRLNLHNVDIIPIVFTTPEEVCILRNGYREGRRQVPESVIRNMRAALTDPKNDKTLTYTDIWYINEYGERCEGF